MDWTQVFKFTSALIASVGGAGLIIVGLSSWLGKVWASRLLERDRHRFSSELEELRHRFTYELEDYRARANVSLARGERYDIRQFELYGTLWAALYDLKLVADKLWAEATTPTLIEFSTQLRATSAEIHRGSLFLEADHYRQLKDVLERFGEFQIGKKRLIDIRSIDDTEGVNVRYFVEDQIEANRHIREEYDYLIESVRRGFVDHLREEQSSRFRHERF